MLHFSMLVGKVLRRLFLDPVLLLWRRYLCRLNSW